MYHVKVIDARGRGRGKRHTTGCWWVTGTWIAFSCRADYADHTSGLSSRADWSLVARRVAAVVT